MANKFTFNSICHDTLDKVLCVKLGTMVIICGALLTQDKTSGLMQETDNQMLIL